MSNVLVEKQKIDILTNAIATKSGESVTMTFDEMTAAVDGIEERFLITFIYDEQSQCWIPDKTYAEIERAIKDGVEIVGVCDTSNSPMDEAAVYFVDCSLHDGQAFLYYDVYCIDQDNTSWIISFMYNDYGASLITYKQYPIPNLQAKTVTLTPQTYDQTEMVHYDNGYTGLSYVYVGVDAMPSMTLPNSPSSSSSGTSKATIGRSTSTRYLNIPTGYNSIAQYYTISAVSNGTAGTPTATKGTVSNHSVSITPSVTNTTGYITGSTINGTAVSVSASELVSGSETKTQNGTYDVTNLAELVVDVSGGGSSAIQVGTATAMGNDYYIEFTGLSGEPTSFAIISSANLYTSDNAVEAVVYDGTSFHGQFLDTSQTTAYTSFLKSYSNGTLSVSNNDHIFESSTEYKLVYSYNGSSSDIHTSDVQVGSGATSITFSSLVGRPLYWSCIFKSDFSTSSGYQRVIAVSNDGTVTNSLSLDSSAKASDINVGASYSGGSLTITSANASSGGYFHQPGYYQLTYAIDSTAPQYQTKTVSPSTSQQTVTADSGYDALEEVIVNAMPSMTLPSSTSATSSGTSKATISASSSTQYLNIPTGYNATAQYYTISASGGGGGSLTVATKTTTLNATSQTLSFSSLSGEPKYWFLRATTNVSSSGSTTYYYVTDCFYDGTSIKGNTFRIGSTRRVQNVTSGITQSYSGNTLTITAGSSSGATPGQFYGTSNFGYELVYIY